MESKENEVKNNDSIDSKVAKDLEEFVILLVKHSNEKFEAKYKKLKPIAKCIIKNLFIFDFEKRSKCQQEIFFKVLIQHSASYIKNYIDQENDQIVDYVSIFKQQEQFCHYKTHLSKIFRRANFLILKKQHMQGKPDATVQKSPTKPNTIPSCEIVCPRHHLPNLVHRYPDRGVFNHKITTSNKCRELNASDMTWNVFLNLPKINWKIKMPNFQYVRKNPGDFKMFVVNRKNKDSPDLGPLSKELYFKSKGKLLYYNKSFVKTFLQRIQEEIKKISLCGTKELLLAMFEQITSDLESSPEVIANCEMKYFLNHLPYIREHTSNIKKKKKEKKENNYKLDLYLLEIFYPSLVYEMNLIDLSEEDIQENSEKFRNLFLNNIKNCFDLEFECVMCDSKFDGRLGEHLVRVHYVEMHLDELSPHWVCPGCNQSIDMLELCKNRWFHKCVDIENTESDQNC